MVEMLTVEDLCDAASLDLLVCFIPHARGHAVAFLDLHEAPAAARYALSPDPALRATAALCAVHQLHQRLAV